jgi:hypothetical protein
MSNSYLIVLKSKNIFNSHVQKVALFRTFESAYEFGKKLDSISKKEIIYTKEEVEKYNLLWFTTKTIFPQITCKLYALSNDTILNIYLSCPIEEKNILQYLYKNLKVNNVI